MEDDAREEREEKREGKGKKVASGRMAGWGLSDFTSAISTIQDTVKSLEKQVDNALGVDEATLRQGIISVNVYVCI